MSINIVFGAAFFLNLMAVAIIVGAQQHVVLLIIIIFYVKHKKLKYA